MTDGPRTMNVGEMKRRAAHTDGDGHLTLWGARDIIMCLVRDEITRAWASSGDVLDILLARLMGALVPAMDALEDATLRTHDAFGCNLDTEATGRYACNACVESGRRADALDAAKTTLGYSTYHDLDDDEEVEINMALREASLRRREVLRERNQSDHDADGRERGAVSWTDLKHELGLCESSDDVAREEIIARIRSGVPDAPDLRHPIDKIAHRLAFLENVIMSTRAELRREGLLFGGDA